MKSLIAAVVALCVIAASVSATGYHAANLRVAVVSPVYAQTVIAQPVYSYGCASALVAPYTAQIQVPVAPVVAAPVVAAPVTAPVVATYTAPAASAAYTAPVVAAVVTPSYGYGAVSQALVVRHRDALVQNVVVRRDVVVAQRNVQKVVVDNGRANVVVRQNSARPARVNVRAPGVNVRVR
jgi:hypothetical protein